MGTTQEEMFPKTAIDHASQMLVWLQQMTEKRRKAVERAQKKLDAAEEMVVQQREIVEKIIADAKLIGDFRG